MNNNDTRPGTGGVFRDGWSHLVIALAVLAAVLTGILLTPQTSPLGATTAQTATALALTPHPGNLADDVRALNAMSRPGAPKMGDLLLALWDGRQSGGAAAIATAGPVFDIAAYTAMVHGKYLSGSAISGQTVPAGCSTGAAEYRKCSICVNASATPALRPGAVAASAAAAVQPACLDNETELGYVVIPPAFTPGTSRLTPTAAFFQNTPRADGVQFGNPR